MILALTALKGFGQSDSVTISSTVANRIEKELQDCQLVKLQYKTLQEADEIQVQKISSLNMQKQLLQSNIKDLEKQITRYERKIKRKNFWNAVYKSALPVAVVGALLIK